ncbi:acetyl-CoA carboxylase family protein [Phaeacidiphilus oryzae]|uniref:acetyl-CoA carboxylase family protein n=1 Tax=Phaeacidiphilus oryzae TaxID=348818 RepID=UPI000564AE35|nr:carboxyl transferase domain-containing protein [Phaeacidiphilus oryzae]
MGVPAVLVANRGEIAVRIVRAAAEAGLRSVAGYAEDEPEAAHARLADEAVPLPGSGPAAYLDGPGIAAVAAEAGCELLHPGYGFLSEDAGFARACAERGVGFVGPAPEVLELLGDKARARALAKSLGVPVLPGTEPGEGIGAARRLLAEHGSLMVKAVGGGGGRGLRAVRDPEGLAEAWQRCASEAGTAFGRAEVYAERLLTGARHIEVQVLGDGTGAVSHLWERDCSAQRRNQKLIELAPAPGLDPALRDRLIGAALRLAGEVAYRGLGTFEFLVQDGGFWFLEANPRLQVEHTVTEEVTGVDLVAAQLRIAVGETLDALGLAGPPPAPRGSAVQLRLYAERLGPDGEARPSAGTLRRFDLPTGPGVRVDTACRPGDAVGVRYDPLLAKIVVRGGSPSAAVERARRALAELRVDGVRTGAALLEAVLALPELPAGRVHTGRVAELVAAGGVAGAAGDEPPEEPLGEDEGEGEDTAAVRAPLAGTVLSLDVAVAEQVGRGQRLMVLEAMKMEHVVRAPAAGSVLRLPAAVGETVDEGVLLALLAPSDSGAGPAVAEEAQDPDRIRPDLAESLARHAVGLDAGRPEAVARRHRVGRRTARENIADLCDDPASFAEHGALAIAAQRQRRPLDDLIANTPADGMVTGTATVNGERCVAMSYDYTVLAGTQGFVNHRKTDRMLELAGRGRLPVVLFAEGGGGRPGDTDTTKVAGLDVPTFRQLARLSGRVPLVGIASGRCFAGNAALLGCCDVVIATPDANIGMGGPAMIEGGGLGVHRPEDIGPIEVQTANGVVDLVAADDADAVRLARRYLSYFQDAIAGRAAPESEWTAPDQRLLRHVVPENRRRAYDVHAAATGIFDTDSVLELREAFGVGIRTCLARLAGRPVGVIASNPLHLGGAIDADAADKAARFLQLCEAFGLPIVSLCDTPGFMVGPESERTATVRHFSRMFVGGANLTVPLVAVVLRKAYGLGAMAMLGGSTHAPAATLAWPSGEFGGMGLEGAVRLGYRRELEAVEDPVAREAEYRRLVDAMYERGKAVNTAAALEIDDVIDPADTRARILAALPAPGTPAARPEGRERRPFVDTW